MLKAVIFDCDGVLVDSEVVYLESLKYYLHKLGVETETEDIMHVVGGNITAITIKLQAQFNLYQYTVNELIVDQRKEFHNMFYNQPVYPMDGLIEFLRDLKANNIKVAVASSSPRKYIVDLLKDFRIECYFDVIVSGEEVVHSKPEPDIFLEAVERLGVDTTEALVIEDSVNGIKAGKAANIKVIGLKESKLIQNTEEADVEVNHFNELSVQRCLNMII